MLQSWVWAHGFAAWGNVWVIGLGIGSSSLVCIVVLGLDDFMTCWIFYHLGNPNSRVPASCKNILSTLKHKADIEEIRFPYLLIIQYWKNHYLGPITDFYFFSKIENFVRQYIPFCVFQNLTKRIFPQKHFILHPFNVEFNADFKNLGNCTIFLNLHYVWVIFYSEEYFEDSPPTHKIASIPTTTKDIKEILSFLESAHHSALRNP